MARIRPWHGGSGPRNSGLGARGFILVDTLVSLIITSLVVGVLFAAVSQSATSTQRTTDQYRASSYARSKIAELRSQQSLPEGRTDGLFDNTFSWSLNVARNESLMREHESAPLVALDIELNVVWGRGLHRYRRVYRTMMLRRKGIANARPALETREAEA